MKTKLCLTLNGTNVDKSIKKIRKSIKREKKEQLFGCLETSWHHHEIGPFVTTRKKNMFQNSIFNKTLILHITQSLNKLYIVYCKCCFESKNISKVIKTHFKFFGFLKKVTCIHETTTSSLEDSSTENLSLRAFGSLFMPWAGFTLMTCSFRVKRWL